VCLTQNVFFKIVYGDNVTIGHEHQAFTETLRASLKIPLSLFEFIPGLSFLCAPGMKKRHHLFSIAHSYLEKAIAERRAEKREASSESARDFLDMFLLAKEEHPEVSELALISTLRGVFTAASSSVVDTLDWLIAFWCSNPQVQERCYKEIEEKLQGRPPLIGDAPNLPHLDGAIKEVFRLRPPALVAHRAERDFYVGGYLVRKGSVVAPNYYGIGNSEKFFKDPHLFDPERWIRNPELSSLLLLFGYGPTTCLGVGIAKQEAFLIAASLIQKYKFQLDPTSHLDLAGEFGIDFHPKEWHTIVSLR